MSRILIITLLLALSQAYASTKFDPEQVEKFNNTGICTGCDLSGARLYWRKGNADLSQAILSKTSLGGIYTNSNFSNSKMAYANLAQVNASACDFDSSILTYAYLNSINASGSSFNNSNMSNADLSNGSFSGADFTGANMTGADLTGADLVDANISEDQLKSVKSLCRTVMPNGVRHSC